MASKIKFIAVAGLYNAILNHLADKDIPVFNIVFDDFGFSAVCYAQDYKTVAELGRKYGTKIRILKKQGLYFRLKNILNRKGLLAGVAVSLLLYMIFTHIVWTVDIKTDNPELKNDIAVQLYTQGIYTGTFYSKEEFAKAAKNLLRINKTISYISLNFYQGILVCEINEKTEKADYISTLSSEDIYSSLSGVISDLRVYEGYAQVELGQSVSRGQILVSHTHTDRHGRVFTAKTRAYIEAIADKTYTVEIPFNKRTMMITGQKTTEKTLITPFGSLLLTSAAVPADFLQKTKMEYLSVMGFHLPVLLITDDFYHTDTVTINHDSLTARKIGQLQLENMIKNDEKLKYEINRNYDYILKEDSLVVFCHINGCYEIT